MPAPVRVGTAHIGDLEIRLAVLALRAAGYNVRNYTGSWHEWSRHSDLPLEK